MFSKISTQHVCTILTEIFEWRIGDADPRQTLLVYDCQTPLSQILATAYQEALPQATAIDFDQSNPAAIQQAIDALNPGDLVILVQSTSFRLDAFRIRVHLFERGLKVIEHPHLGRVLPEEIPTYIATLAYDREYYQSVGRGLKDRLDQAREVKLYSGDNILTYGGPLEIAKLNIGDYRGMKNAGGQFPIGEVFTELKDLAQLNGRVGLFAFGDQNFSVCNAPQPIVIEIQKGKLVSVQNSLPSFDAVLEDIRRQEGDVWVRELGFGLNRALTRTTQIAHDVGIYERMCGVHLSLGGKHALYPKEGFSKKKMRFHVDVFAAVESATVDGDTVYQNGSYVA